MSYTEYYMTIDFIRIISITHISYISFRHVKTRICIRYVGHKKKNKQPELERVYVSPSLSSMPEYYTGDEDGICKVTVISVEDNVRQGEEF